MFKVIFSVLSLCYPILVLALLRFLGDDSLGILFKFYPFIINVVMLAFFGFSLLNPPTKVFKIALLSDSSIKNSPHLPEIESYCYTVTKVWCVFFVLNASVSLATILYASDNVWALYNGFIAYIFMGILFSVEWLVRKKVQSGLK